MASTVVIRFIQGDGANGPTDSAVALAEEDLTSSGAAVTTSIQSSGANGEICVVYPLSENQRVSFGSTASATSGPVAFAGQPNAFRNVGNGNTVSVITAPA